MNTRMIKDKRLKGPNGTPRQLAVAEVAGPSRPTRQSKPPVRFGFNT